LASVDLPSSDAIGHSPRDYYARRDNVPTLAVPFQAAAKLGRR
jgi:hypothetical protein